MKSNSFVKALASLIVISSLVFLAFGCEKEKEKGKTEKPGALTEFKAAISIENPPTNLKVDSPSTVTVKVKNVSDVVWHTGASINLAYHWLDKDGAVVVFDGLRTPVPQEVKPNEEITLVAKVLAPNKAGNYILEFDMVQETIAWFKNKGSKTTRLIIKVD